METGKLKTIVILILLCLNLAFCGILLAEQMDTAAGTAQSRNELTRVLEGLGISLDADVIPGDAPMTLYTVSRDRETEQALVLALLGEADSEDQGGNIRRYENENGWARFRSGGVFELNTTAAGGALESRLRGSGLSIVREADSYICTAGDAQVFNCHVSLSQRAGGIYLSGRVLPGRPEAEESAESPDAATLLLHFHDGVRDAGGVYTEIREILPGYLLNVTASSLELLPVWRITTDGGVWYLDVKEQKLVAESAFFP